MITLFQIGKMINVNVDSRLPIPNYHIDSREVSKGGLFFAIKGEKVDGHDYLEEVAARGGYGAVVNRSYRGPSFGLVLLKVEDVTKALQTLAREVLAKKKTKVIGITGSVGKTTTKEFLHDLLKTRFTVEKNPRSYNSQLTLPLVILRAPEQLDFLILEMSMTSKGHIANLVNIAPPTLVIMTPIGLVHAGFFNSVEEIAEAKSEILSPSVEFAAIHAKAIRFKAVQKALIAEHIVYNENCPVACPLKEAHFRENFSGAYEIAKYLGMSNREIEQAASKLKPMEHRFELKSYKGITFVDASYNANPLSAIAALRGLPKPKKEGAKRVAVFGAMGELGKFSFMSHREVAREALDYIDHLLVIGKEAEPMVEVFKKSGRPAELFDSYDRLAGRMREISKEGDVVLVKGSNYHRLWEIIEFAEKSS